MTVTVLEGLITKHNSYTVIILSQESLVNTGLCTFKLIFHFWFNRQKKKYNKINPPYVHEKAQDLN